MHAHQTCEGGGGGEGGGVSGRERNLAIVAM